MGIRVPPRVYSWEVLTSRPFLGVVMAERVLHGVNLSGWLILEPWVTPELFAGSGSLGEDTLAESLGEDVYAELLLRHWDTFITEDDFAQIAQRGLNAVRILVPWYVFGDKGPNAGYHLGCLTQVDNALSWAAKYDISILLTFGINPGAPGEENVISVGGSGHREDLLVVLSALAKRYADWPAFFGIEVANNPVAQHRRGFSVVPGVPLHVLRNFYRDAYAAVRNEAGPRPVIVFPDAGLPGAWRSFMAPKRYQNVWLDCHLYHYSDHVDATGPAGTRLLVNASRKTLKEAEKSGLPVMVGTWSGALPFADSAMTPEGRIALERVYVADQLRTFADRPAWFFQTWKTSGRLSGWDSRLALSSFERGMLV